MNKRAFMAAGFVLTGTTLLASASHASLIISLNQTKNVVCSGGVCSPTAKNAVLNTSDLANMLATSDVKVTTGSGAVTITVASPVSWTSGSRLTLDANLTVSFKSPVSVAGHGALSITTNDGGSGGDLLFFPGGHVDFWDPGSSLVVNGIVYTLVDDISSLASGIAAASSGFYALSSDYDATQDGIYKRSPVQTTLSGTFEGLGHSISNLHILARGKGSYYGGLFSHSTGSIRDIHLDRLLVKGDHTPMGGLIGVNDGMLFGDFVNGTVGSVSNSIGGLAGTNNGTIQRCGSIGHVGKSGRVGGLAGTNFGEILYSYSSMVVTSYGGGLAGYNEGSIRNSYAMGSVSGGGGLLGDNVGQLAGVYSTGFVKVAGYTGGLIGVDEVPDSIADAYWDLDTSGVTDPAQGAGFPLNDPGITGLTDAQLTSGLPAGFDPAIWGQDPHINNGYPYLLKNPPS